MNKNNIIIMIFLCLILFSNLVIADVGSQEDLNSLDTKSESLNDDIQNFMDISANSEAQPDIETRIYERKLDLAYTQANLMWNLIIGLIIIVFELIKTGLLLIEMIILYVILTDIVPKTLNILGSSIANAIYNKSYKVKK